MSELRPPTRWSADPSQAPASFADAARDHRGDGPGPEARARMWESLQRGVLSNAPSLTRAWHLPLRVLSTLLIAGTGALFAIRSLPPTAANVAAVTPHTEESYTASSEQEMLDDHALIGGTDTKVVSTAIEQPAPPPQPTTPKRSLAAAGSSKRTPDSADEVGLLVRARRLLRSQPARALELTQAHSAQYPHGMFTEERELLAIEALYQLGQRKLADQRSARFLATFPKSAHGSRIEALRSAQ